ncbi:hypothetical protein HHK36_031574 [Tetracentron sinense]|uniref:Uncharacterized protein n=1 Tax=Tetracentron sinense TaxID=13715 RepID=A0A834YB03_TETSI|nr:hypothetical protein HHK36_031574 [Tetracentron sinense]
MQQMRKGKTQVEESGIGAYFAPRTTPGSQPSIKSFLATKEAKENVDMSIGRWLYDTCNPFNAVNSFYFQPMVDVIARIDDDEEPPTLDTYEEEHIVVEAAIPRTERQRQRARKGGVSKGIDEDGPGVTVGSGAERFGTA